MLGSRTNTDFFSPPTPFRGAQRTARQQTLQAHHVLSMRMSVLAQPTCDRKLLVSCYTQQQLRDFVPFTDLSAISTVTAYSRGPSGTRGRRHQVVHCRATRQEVATKRLLEQQQAADVLTAESTVKVPILSGGGGGIFFWWEMGEHEDTLEHVALALKTCYCV